MPLFMLLLTACGPSTPPQEPPVAEVINPLRDPTLLLDITPKTSSPEPFILGTPIDTLEGDWCLTETTMHRGGYSLTSCGSPLRAHMVYVEDGILVGLKALVDDDLCAAAPERMSQAYSESAEHHQGLTGEHWSDGTYKVDRTAAGGLCSLSWSTVTP